MNYRLQILSVVLFTGFVIWLLLTTDCVIKRTVSGIDTTWGTIIDCSY